MNVIIKLFKNDWIQLVLIFSSIIVSWTLLRTQVSEHANRIVKIEDKISIHTEFIIRQDEINKRLIRYLDRQNIP